MVAMFSSPANEQIRNPWKGRSRPVSIKALEDDLSSAPENLDPGRREVIPLLLDHSQNPDASPGQPVIRWSDEEDDTQVIVAPDRVVDPEFTDIQTWERTNP
jgi:hypothetical protein